MLVSLVVAGLALPGCGHRRLAIPRPDAPNLADATGQARCGVRRSADKPLVVEWPVAERAALEARAQQGLVAVRYEGCEMEVLSGCDVAGDYTFVALSPKQERVSIRDVEELYARLPVGAAALEGKLAHSGELVVDMTIAGRKQTDQQAFGPQALSGRCASATHVVTGLTIGAFSLLAGAATEGGAKLAFANVGGGGSVSRSQELVASDGDPAVCATAGWPNAPAHGCGAVLRVEVVPLTDANGISVASRSDDLVAVERWERQATRRQGAGQGLLVTSGVAAVGALASMVVVLARTGQIRDATWDRDGASTDYQFAWDASDRNYASSELERLDARIATLQRQRQRAGIITAGLFAGSAALLGAGVGLRSSARRLRSQAGAMRNDLRVAPSLSPAMAGLTFAGRF